MMNLSLLLNWLLQTLVAFVSTIAFSVIFHAPRRESLCVGVTGGAGWLMYLVCTHLGCGVAALVLGIVVLRRSRKYKEENEDE